jgi:GTP cyclohydrolase IA
MMDQKGQLLKSYQDLLSAAQMRREQALNREDLELAARIEYGEIPELQRKIRILTGEPETRLMERLMEQQAAVEQFMDTIWPQWRKDPEMAETPRRVLDGWRELLSGDGVYDDWTTFDTIYTGIVARVGIPVNAICAHHLLSYIGTIDFAYIPDGKKLGISKIIRWAQYRCRVPSSQEELTQKLVNEFMEKVKPKGIVLRFKAYHLCEATRGVRVAGVATLTESVSGVFMEKPAAREEAMELFRAGRRSEE